MVGWTLAMGGAGLSIIVFETAGGGRWPAVIALALAGIGGMAYGAHEAARRRDPRDQAAPRRQATAWTLAGVFAFLMLAVSLSAFDSQTPLAGRDFYAQGARLLVWFGAVGGFLAVAAAAEWQLRIGAFIRGLIAAVAWASLLLFSGAVSVVGLFAGVGALADSVGSSSPIVAGLLIGTVSGVFLGICGEAVNRRTLRPPG